MDRNALRSEIQDQTVEEWVNQGYQGYALIGMGVGKSRLLAMAIKKYLEDHPEFDYKKYDHPIVVLVDSSELRDSGLPKELKKWGVTVKVKIVCYQTAYRWSKKIGLLLADELDFAITSGRRYLQVFNKCTYDAWLGVTGTMIEAKGEVAEEIFGTPPFFKFSLANAQDAGLINKTEVWIHEVPMYTSATPTAPYGEVNQYLWISQKIEEIKRKISGVYDSLAFNPTFDEEMRLKDILSALYRQKEYWESKKSNSNNRMTMMHTMKSLSDYAKVLKQALLSDDSNKVIIFSELTAEVDKITHYAFHGKQTDRKVVDQLNEGEIKELGVVRKVNRGVNFEGLNHAIVHAYTSSVTNAAQAYIGRMVRLEPDEVARVHFLVSYFYYGDQKMYAHNMNWLASILNSEELSHLEIKYYDGINLLNQFFNEVT